MPRGLKFLTACSAAAPLCVLQTLLPGGHVIVGGQQIANGHWWRSGAGLLYATPAVLITLAALGMMRRARGSRALFVAGFLLSAPAVVWIPQLVLGSPRAGIENVAPLVVMALGIATYVYASAAVRSYFRGHDHSSSRAASEQTRG